MSVADAAWPRDLLFKRDARALCITFDDGASFEIPFELLRIESPSAEDRGHGPAARVIGGKRGVMAVRAEPVGRYAVRIVFDDGHDTGLYSWDFLRTLGREREQRMHDYLRRLSEAGLSRD